MVIKLVLVILLSRLRIAISSHESSSTTNQPLEDSGYSKVRFGVPDLTIRCKMPENLHTQSCLVTPIASNGSLKHNDVVWSIAAGIEAYAGTVSVVTFASALLSAILIIIASLQLGSRVYRKQHLGDLITGVMM